MSDNPKIKKYQMFDPKGDQQCMNIKLKVLLGGVFLTGFVAMLYIACLMTFEWWQAKPIGTSNVAEHIWNLHGAGVLVVWMVLLWLFGSIIEGARRREKSDGSSW